MNEYLIENNLKLEDVKVEFSLSVNKTETHDDLTEDVESDEKIEPSTPTTFPIGIKSFSNEPEIWVESGNENILYVDDIEIKENFCGTAKLTIRDNMYWLNACQMDGKNTVTLDVALSENMCYPITFEVRKKDKETPQISKLNIGTLNENEISISDIQRVHLTA